MAWYEKFKDLFAGDNGTLLSSRSWTTINNGTGSGSGRLYTNSVRYETGDPGTRYIGCDQPTATVNANHYAKITKHTAERCPRICVRAVNNAFHTTGSAAYQPRGGYVISAGAESGGAASAVLLRTSTIDGTASTTLATYTGALRSGDVQYIYANGTTIGGGGEGRGTGYEGTVTDNTFATGNVLLLSNSTTVSFRGDDFYLYDDVAATSNAAAFHHYFMRGE